ncbi:fatty acid CoA ligase family protein [Cerasicoccus arenae]|uniref:Peptide synthase n=1 Tax=Cerasicoccus arenae TaxID=424488 RepID=A0A8J3DDH3_9BACT|nr:fatty acid CoA ligase family protein [Cerasicoccus arenae]MBK1859652.1 AMP-binding protein [Cerasicoccus arenae]GHC07481.1 peptide synthase [Cerasicoccus arenae]
MGETADSTSPISNVARFLPEAAARQPDFPALRVPIRSGKRLEYDTLTFAQLETLACAAAQVFAAKGIARGTRVLLMVKPGRDLILSVFALFKMGAVPVVIDPGMGRKHFLACVRRTQPEALVGIPLAQILGRVYWRHFGSLRTRVTVGTKGFARQLDALGKASFEPAPTTADELAAILFTSGSTGPPKGVRYEHGMFEAQVRMIRAQYGIQRGGVDLPMLPVFALFNPALGLTTVVPEMNPSRPATVDPKKIVQAILQNQVTNSFGSPVLWNKIVGYCEEKNLTLPSIRCLLMAGAAAPPPLIRRLKALLPNGEIHTPYGATEVLPVASISGTEILRDAQPLTEQGRGVCVGRLLPEVSAKIIAISDEPIAQLTDVVEQLTGAIGEILVTGPSVTKAYDALPEATAKAKITAQPTSPTIWHRMGDLGYFDAEGRLWFCGRMAERVETSAGPLYTECVEAIFNKHPRVFRSALVGLGERPNQRPCVVVEPLPGAWPQDTAAQSAFTAELSELAASSPLTSAIAEFRFWKKFPVDVRHNAKIHRLELARSVIEIS